MLSVEQALELVAQEASPLAPRRVPLGEADGLVLAEDVVSEFNSPPYDKSMMDGYAVRSGDSEAERRIIEEIAAGAVPRLPIRPGTASRIMTGAPIPEGADAVVPVEQTELLNESTVRLERLDASPGQHIIRLATALRAGDVVLRQGAVIRPIEIAILAEIGLALVRAQPRPQVAILATGNELVSIGERLAAGQIRNSNGPMLLAAATRAGAEAADVGIARDDRDELKRLMQQGLTADVLVLSGGVSAGKFDLVPEVLGELGVRQVFHKIALRPGKPLWFGVRDDGDHRTLVFGLPGNPMSSFVCFELFTRPAISALAGRGFVGASAAEGRLSHDLEHKGGRAACLPARLTPPPKPSGATELEKYAVEILPWHGSSDLASMARANCLARLPREPISLPAGGLLEVLLI